MLNTFILLGLKEDHLKIYQAGLEWGKTTISNLAYKSKLPRTTIYGYIDELIDLGLLRVIPEEGKKLYLAADPEYLITLLQKKSVEVKESILNIEQNMENIKAMQSKRGVKPTVRYLEGPEGIKQAYEMTLSAKGEVWVQCYSEGYQGVVKGFFDGPNNYFDRFFGSNIKSKELLTFSDGEYAKKWGSEKNLQLFVNTEKFGKLIETDLMLFDNTVIYVSFNKENPYALVLEDENIYNANRSMYDLAWKAAKLEDPRILAGEKVKTEF